MFLWYTGGIHYFFTLPPVKTSHSHLTGHFHGLGAWLFSIACRVRCQLDPCVCVGAVPGTIPSVGSAPRSLPGVRPAPRAFPGVRPAPLSFQRGYAGARSGAGPHQPGHASRGHVSHSLNKVFESFSKLGRLGNLGEPSTVSHLQKCGPCWVQLWVAFNHSIHRRGAVTDHQEDRTLKGDNIYSRNRALNF